jgi:hypothetical protein
MNQLFGTKSQTVMFWLWKVPPRLVCWSLAIQMLSLLGGNGNFMRWGLVRGGSWKWCALEGLSLSLSLSLPLSLYLSLTLSLPGCHDVTSFLRPQASL